MKQLILSAIIFILGVISAGCAKPCFYQAGKSIKQCERDLMQCIYEVELSSYIPNDLLSSPVSAGVQEGIQPTELTCLCMQAMGYEFLEANTLPKNRKRMKIVTLVDNYWVVDGLGVALVDPRILSEQKHKENDPEHKEVIERLPEISDELRQAIIKIVR
ncbi:hypothetical protein ACFL3Q_07700 [Planctomycetota bacterium]